MRIRSVHARSFGGFVDETLEFAEGLTVVTGPNESGKSTWHAAITAMVCGMRRGRGRRRQDDQAFVERHHPWGRDEFTVGGMIGLADGRLVEMRHDLAGLVDCTATDAVLGTDLTAEILNEGTPDASRFVGLDRTTFRAIARVSQGEVLAVIDDAEVLQEDLHRAAATAGSDETAAAAIQIVDEVRRDEVGRDIANSTRPLRRAKEAVAAAETAEAEVRRAHDEWRQEQERITVLAEEAETARRRLAEHEAVAARERVERARRQVEELERLSADLDELPVAPTGDTHPAEEVLAAARTFEECRSDLAAHRRLEPEIAGEPLPDHLDAAAVEDLRNRLSASASVSTEAPKPAPRDAPPGRPHRRGVPSIVFVGAALLLIAGIVFALVGARVVGSVLVAAGAGAAIGSLVVARTGRRAASSTASTAPPGSELGDAGVAGVADSVRALGLPADVAELTRLLDRHRRAIAARADHRRWVESGVELGDRLLGATLALADALIGRGVSVASDTETGRVGPSEVREAFDRYRKDCHRRSRDAEGEVRERRVRLDALLAGRSLDEHRRELVALEARADELAARCPDGLPERRSGSTDDPSEQREALRAEAERAGTELARLTAAHRVRSAGMPSVAEAVEATSAARTELERVERFAADLTATRRFLEVAQAEVNRDIAPRLASSVRRDIAAVTGGRYGDVRIDPSDLTVTVQNPEGRWPKATHLSHGTAEQIHLLLRFALADAMVADGRRVPMLLDDVLVQSDRGRSEALLELLRERAADRQIILFSQEGFVRDWAATELVDDPRHAHVELTAP